MQGRVILSHGRSLQALAVAQSLARRDIEIIGCDNMPLTVLAFSKYVQKTFVLPSPTQVTEDEYIEALVEQIKAHRPADGVPYVLMPVDWETRLFAKHRQRLAPYITLAAPLWDTLQRVDPKHNLVQTAREYDLRIPPTVLPADADEVYAKADSLNFPVFIKVPDASGGNGIRHCHDAAELCAAYDELAQHFQFSPTYQPLIQEAVGDSDCCVTLLAQHGEVKAHATYRNLRAFPVEAGSGVWRETIADDDALLDIASNLARSLNWHGMAQLDFRLDDASGDAWLIEVNPRFFAGLFQTIASGVDYPWLLYRMSLGESIATVAPPETGVQTHIPVTATLSLLEDAITQGLDFEQLRLGWQEAWDASKEGDFKSAWQSFSQRVQSVFSPSKDGKSLSEQFAELNKAKMEGLSWDDPLTSLGILVILGALVKTGKLPEEMNTSSKKGDFKSAD